MASVKNRAHLVISGDLHAIAIGRMLRSGRLDLKDNPVNVVLSGRSARVPALSAGRRDGAAPARCRRRISNGGTGKPIEQHGFYRRGLYAGPKK